MGSLYLTVEKPHRAQLSSGLFKGVARGDINKQAMMSMFPGALLVLGAGYEPPKDPEAFSSLFDKTGRQRQAVLVQEVALTETSGSALPPSGGKNGKP